MKKIGVFLFLWSMMSGQAAAQILNIEKARLERDTTKNVLANFGFMFGARQQQAQVITFSSAENIAVFTKRHQYSLMSSFDLVRLNGNKIVSNGFVHLRSNFYKQNTFSGEIYAQAQYDEIRGMEYRYLLGAGPRWKVQHDEQLTLAFGTSLMYEDERWLFAEQDSATQLLKSSTYFSYHHQWVKHVEINLIVYYQALFRYFDRPRIAADVHLNIALSRRLTLSVKYIFLYDVAPVVPIDRLIYNLQNGVQLKF